MRCSSANKYVKLWIGHWIIAYTPLLLTILAIIIYNVAPGRMSVTVCSLCSSAVAVSHAQQSAVSVPALSLFLTLNSLQSTMALGLLGITLAQLLSSGSNFWIVIRQMLTTGTN
jgi:hypothetical protein